MDAHDRPDPAQMRIFAAMPAEQKLALADRLRTEALALKEAWLRMQHPDASDDEIRRRLHAWMHGGSTRLD